MPQCPQFCGHIVLPGVVMAVAVVLLSWQYYSINTPDTATKRQQPTATSLHPFTIRSSLFLPFLAPSSPQFVSIPPSPTKYVHIDPLTLPHPPLFLFLSLFTIFSRPNSHHFHTSLHHSFPFTPCSSSSLISSFLTIRPSSFSPCPPSFNPPSSSACIFFSVCLCLTHSLHINWCIFAAEHKKKEEKKKTIKAVRGGWPCYCISHTQ